MTSFTAVSLSIRLVLLLSFFLAFGDRALAFVSPTSCGDGDSDLGTHCSLAEVEGGRVIVDNVRFYNISLPLGDADAGYPISKQIRVVPVGEGTARPGIRFEVENGAMNHDPCVMGTDPVAFTPIGYFVAATDLTLGDIQVHTMTMTGEGFATSGVGEFAFNLAQNWPPAQSAHSDTDPFPFEFEIDDMNFLVVELGLSTQSPGAFPNPEAHCGTRAGISWFEQRVELRNVPAIPPEASDSGDIPCTIDEKGALCPTVGVETDPDCPEGASDVTIVDVLGAPVVQVSTCSGEDNSTALTQSIDTPNSSFEIWFDYRFESAARLDVYINTTQIDSIEGEPDGTFQRARILVNDPGLMNLEDATLQFELVEAPGRMAFEGASTGHVPRGDNLNIFIANIFSPLFELQGLSVVSTAKAQINGLVDVPPLETHVLADSLETDCTVTVDLSLVCQVLAGSPPVYTFGSGLFLLNETEFLESPFGDPSDSFARSSSRAFAIFQGVGTGIFAEINNDASAKSTSSGAAGEKGLQANGTTGSGVQFMAISSTLAPGSLFPVRYKLRINGTATIDLDEPMDSAGFEPPDLSMRVLGSVAISRAKRDGDGDAAAYDGSVKFGLDPVDPPFLGAGDMELNNNCPKGEDENDPAPGTSPLKNLVIDTFPKGQIKTVTFEVDQAFCFPDVLHAGVGDTITVKLSAFSTNMTVNSDFDGTIVVNFADTAFSELSAPGYDVQFQAIGLGNPDTLFKNGFDEGILP